MQSEKQKRASKCHPPLQIQYHHFESLPLTANLFFISFDSVGFVLFQLNCLQINSTALLSPREKKSSRRGVPFMNGGPMQPTPIFLVS